MKKIILSLGLVTLISINLFLGFNYSKGNIDLRSLFNISNANAESPEWCFYENGPVSDWPYKENYHNASWALGNDHLTYIEYKKYSYYDQSNDYIVWATSIDAATAIAGYFSFTLTLLEDESKNLEKQTCDGSNINCCAKIIPSKTAFDIFNP